MSDPDQQHIEAEARRILRETIQRMPWHQNLPHEERRRRIETDVDTWWYLKIEEATRRLKERQG
jgi:hypothetical protein